MSHSILILCHGTNPPFPDICHQYAEGLATPQTKVTIAFLTGEPDDHLIKKNRSSQVVFLNLPKKKLRYLKLAAIYQVYRLCQQEKFSIVICHRYKAQYVMLFVAQFLKIPVIISVMHELNTMQSFGRKYLLALLAKRTLYLAGVSEAITNNLKKHLSFLPRLNILTLYNAIDVEHSQSLLLNRKDARKFFNIAEDTFLVGHIARLVINKDQTTLIKAFAQFKLHHSNAKLILIGEGPLKETLKQQVIQLHLEEDVIFSGFIPGAQRFISAFDCFVLSSVQEAFGLVLLEAMLAKIPIIATAVDGIPEVLGKDGVLVKCREPNLLADAMQKILRLSKEERQTYGELGYQRLIHYFSISAFREQLKQIPLLREIIIS